MALANVRTSGDPSGVEMKPGDRTLGAPSCHCAIAIGALERVSNAIACADIEARCKAVATATEAMTSHFLEFDGIDPLSFTGRPMGGMVDLSDAAIEDKTTRRNVLDLAKNFVGSLPAK